MKRTLPAVLAAILVAGIALAANVDNAKRYLKGGIDLWNDLASKDTASTFSITSDTTAATMTSSVAAVTIAPTATPAANDLVLEVNDAAGTSLFSVDNEGDVVFAGTLACGVGAITGDISLTGNDLTATGTGQTFNIVSDANDATTSSTVAAVTLKTSVNVTAGDLILNVEDSAGTNLLTCDEEGDVVAAGDISAAGNDINCSGTGATCLLLSAANDTTVSSTVAAVTIKASVNVTAGDLVLEVNDSADASLMTVDEEGDVVTAGRVSNSHAYTVADSGDGNPATSTLNPTANTVLLTCSDTDGCTITMGETGAVAGTIVTIVNISANAASFSDSAGVSELTGAFSMGANDSLTLVYGGSTWNEVARSNN